MANVDHLLAQFSPIRVYGKVHRIVGQGSIHREIIAAAEKADADLIVMASHKPTARDYLLGANAAHVVRHAACSVMVVRN